MDKGPEISMNTASLQFFCAKAESSAGRFADKFAGKFADSIQGQHSGIYLAVKRPRPGRASAD